MQDAIQRSLDRNPDLKAFGYELQAQRPRAAGGRSSFDSAETTLNLGFLLEHGARQRRIDAARAGSSLAETEAQIRRLDAAAEMDEAARESRLDPVALRLALLDGKGRNAGSAPNSVGGASRQARVLKRAPEKAGWGSAVPKDTGLGIATTFGQERTMPTWIACVARVRVDRGSGMVKLEKLTIVTDAGTIVHPDGALAQTEGAALWGASLALHEGTEIEKGQVKDTNLDTYTPLRMGDVPEMESL